jgi:anaerobic magnesium-protoporphyrin IX monomethyl ester cyclase
MYKIPKKCDIILIHPSKGSGYGQIGSLSSTTPDILLGLMDAYLESNGIISVIIDLDVVELSKQEIIDLIIGLDPKLVGVFSSGVNVSSSTQTMPSVIGLFNDVVNLFPSKIKTFVHGGHPTTLPERTLNETLADYVINGEGYSAVLSLVNNLINGIDNSNIDGIAYLSDGKYSSAIINPMPPLVDVNILPMINWEKMNPGLYRAHNWHCFGDDVDSRTPYGVIWTSMGCAYPCDFCCVNNIFGERTFRFRDMKAVVEEIDILVNNYGVKNLRIMDELFVIKHPRIEEFCDLMDERGYDLNIWCYARVDSVTPQILKRLKKIGVNWVGYGFETGDDENALKSINKGVKKGSLSNDEVIKITREAGINMIGHAILGLYDDDEDSIRKNVDFLRKHQFEWNNIYPAFAYPGTPFYDQYVGEGIIEEPRSWEEYGLYSDECKPLPTKHLTSAQVLRLRDELFNEYYSDQNVQDNLRIKFGQKTIDHINEMLSVKLKRKILAD